MFNKLVHFLFIIMLLYDLKYFINIQTEKKYMKIVWQNDNKFANKF